MAFMIRSRPKEVEILKKEFLEQERARINSERTKERIGNIRAEARREAEREFMTRPQRAKATLTTAGRKAQSIFVKSATAGAKVRAAFSKFAPASNLKAAAKKPTGLQSMLRK